VEFLCVRRTEGIDLVILTAASLIVSTTSVSPPS
jgi:hypothetical protein